MPGCLAGRSAKNFGMVTSDSFITIWREGFVRFALKIVATLWPYVPFGPTISQSQPSGKCVGKGRLSPPVMYLGHLTANVGRETNSPQRPAKSAERKNPANKIT
jgi:hypothetical protein